MATLFWAEGVWRNGREQQMAWRRQIFDVQTWRQVMGLAGAVLCETRDLGIKCPEWHTLMFEGQQAVDMRVSCPQNVEKASETNHDGLFEEMGGKTRARGAERRSVAGADPSFAAKTDKHPNSTRKLVVEGRWVHKRLYDTRWSHEEMCTGCNKESEAVPLSVMEGGQKPDPRWLGEMGATSDHVEIRLVMAKRNHVASFVCEGSCRTTICRSTGGNLNSTTVGAW